MSWLCPNCGKLQHQIYKCKFCGYKETDKSKKVTAEKLAALKNYRVPESYWKRKRKKERRV